MIEEKFDELVDNITSFIYDWDPYEFKDIYQDYEMGLEDTRECLSSKKTTADVIYNIENICTELEHDDDKNIQDLYKRGSSQVEKNCGRISHLRGRNGFANAIF